MNSKMLGKEECTKDNGTRRQVREMGLASSSGLTVLSTKACGVETRPTIKAK